MAPKSFPRWLARWRWLRTDRRNRFEQEMDEELRFHLEMEIREMVAAGVEPKEARRVARLRFGSLEGVKVASREAIGSRWSADLRQDVRHSWRRLLRSPTFAVVAIGTMGIAIGGAASVAALIDSILLQPLPYPDSERLVRIHTSWENEPDADVSPAELVDYRQASSDVISELAAYVRSSVTVARDGRGERAPAAYVEASLFPALGVPPLRGRTFTREEVAADEALVVVAEGWWKRVLGGDSAVVGERIEIGGRDYTVVGIMPAGFRLPQDHLAGDLPGLFLPLRIDPAVTARGSHFLEVVGRLAPGTTPADAAAAIEASVAAFVPLFPDDYEPETRFRATARPLRPDLVADAKPALRIAGWAVGLVLFVAAINLAGLLLARNEARQPELALRSALGAGRIRLVRQILVEGSVLGALGGALGIAVAAAGLEAVRALAPAGIPRLEAIGLRWPVLLGTTVASVVIGVIVGLAPALQAAGAAPGRALRQGGRATVSSGSPRLRASLVVAQIALAMTLLAGTLMLGRSFAALVAVDTGIDADGVLAAELTIPQGSYPEEGAALDVVDRLEAAAAARPETAAVGVVTSLPFADGIGDLGVDIPGRPQPGGSLAVDWQAASPGYASAVGLRLLQGRWIAAADREDAPGAVVVNRTFAERFWPQGGAVGTTLRLSAGARPEEVRIVGVVEDVRHEGPGTPANLQMYVPYRQFRFWHGGGIARALQLVIREQPGRDAAAAVRATLGEVDPRLALGTPVRLEDAYEDLLARPRFVALLLAAFSVMAAVLACLGIYGIVAHGVVRRRREIGLRLALGAAVTGILRGILAEGGRLAALGLGLGTLGALALARVLEASLYAVSPVDLPSLAGGVLGIGLAAMAASWIPARRAASVPASEALRGE